MNAYVITAGRLRVFEGVGGVDLGQHDTASIRGADVAGQPLATVVLTPGTWVAVGGTVPPGWERPATVAAGVDDRWPSEPPPDVDSEG